MFDVRKKKQVEFWPDLPTVIDPRKRYERYWTYITKSPRWKTIAEKTKRLAKYQCIYCGPTCQGTINLQAHHRNYDNPHVCRIGATRCDPDHMSCVSRGHGQGEKREAILPFLSANLYPCLKAICLMAVVT